MNLHLSRVAVLGVAALALVASATGGAVADRLITSADIQDHTIKREDLATGSVGGRVVKNGSITSADLADGAVDGRVLADGSVSRSELAPGVRRQLARAGTRGPKGATGAAGPAGAAGAAGAAGVSGYELVQQDVTGPGGTVAEALCPAGKKVLSGGWSHVSGILSGIRKNGPKSDGTGWTIQFAGSAGPDTATVQVYAVCAAV